MSDADVFDSWFDNTVQQGSVKPEDDSSRQIAHQEQQHQQQQQRQLPLPPPPPAAPADMSVANTSNGNTHRPSRSPAQRRDEEAVSKIPNLLPHERVFPIQIGSELFKLSGASISSDAPSYFSQYFHCQVKKAQETGEDLSSAIRTLYIDRDPKTFADISLHLQGYHVKPRDGTHFVRLFADAQFYSLPKLISQLYEESIFISIGHREFQIPRDILTDPGNSPNFFSLGFAVFFSNPEDLFPGLDREGLLRPPSILPPSVPHRSAETFSEILHLLRGYPVTIRNEAHRAELLRDCRYFNFKGLEQKLIPHHFGYNQARRRNEIVLRLEDILKSGISVAADVSVASALPGDQVAGWVNYARPYVDERPAELILEIGGESTRLYFQSSSVYAELFHDTRTRVARLFQVVASKLNLANSTQPIGLLMPSGGAGTQPAVPGLTPLSENLVRVTINADTSIILDGKPHNFETPEDLHLPHESATSSTGQGGGLESPTAASTSTFLPNSRKRRRVDSLGNAIAGSHAAVGGEEWVVRTGQWRLKVQGSRTGKNVVEVSLVAVKLDAYSSESAKNAARGFLNT